MSLAGSICQAQEGPKAQEVLINNSVILFDRHEEYKRQQGSEIMKRVSSLSFTVMGVQYYPKNSIGNCTISSLAVIK